MRNRPDNIVGEKTGVRAAIITSEGRIVTEDILKQYQITPPESRQVDDMKWKAPILEPPYDLLKLMSWMNVNVIHSSCIRVKIQDTVGIGYHLEPSEENEGDKIVTEAEEDDEYNSLLNFFKKVNDKESFTMVLKKSFLDWEGCGNSYLEVSRDMGDKINGLYHVNATTVRWCKDKQRLIQRVGQEFVYFKLFGDERILNRKTGNFVQGLSKPEDAANEIIPMNIYSWMSSVYGLPEWLPALYPMFGDMKETEYNIDFFINYGVPAYAVIFEGVTMDPSVNEEITKYFETTLKGSNHKTLCMSTPKGGTIKFERLSVEQKEASFRIYKKDNRQDILASHRVPPYRVGVIEQGQLGGSVAGESDQIYLESVINPRQEEWMWIINQLIIKEGLGITKWEFVFDDINIANKATDATVYNSYIERGVMTPNEARAELGLEPYVGGDVFYISGALIPAGLAPEVELEGEQAEENAAGEQKPKKTAEEEKDEGTKKRRKLVKRRVRALKIISDAEGAQAKEEYISRS
jgi:PBSX family phage portal protein